VKSTNETEKVPSEQLTIPAFGYELVRDILIPEILGKETPDILYWAGKHLARKFPLVSTEEIISFFNKAGWGQLSLCKEDKYRAEFELTSPIISKQFDMNKHSCFKLEAGFLAEQYQNQKKMITEATEELVKRGQKIKFLVQWDLKDFVNDLAE